MIVVYAHKAIAELEAIWQWNLEHYSPDHADRYIEYLRENIDALSDGYDRGKRVGFRPDLRYILIRRKSRGHGHVAVYAVNESQVRVLHVFHSAQDWRAKLTE